MSEEAGFCKSFIGKADSERGWSTCRKEDKADANRQDFVTDPKVYDKGGGVAIKFQLFFFNNPKLLRTHDLPYDRSLK